MKINNVLPPIKCDTARFGTPSWLWKQRISPMVCPNILARCISSFKQRCLTPISDQLSYLCCYALCALELYIDLVRVTLYGYFERAISISSKIDDDLQISCYLHLLPYVDYLLASPVSC
jgi:hypothetical protein